MSSLIINGSVRAIDGIETFGEMLSTIRAEFEEKGQIISTIRMDGAEISPNAEDDYTHLKTANMGNVEIETAAPGMIAEDTLRTLQNFTIQLASLSAELAKLEQTGTFEQELNRLLDGIQAVAETISAVKRVMEIETVAPVELLENEMVEIVKNLLLVRKEGDKKKLQDILQNDLPDNLQHWCQQGIPAILDSKK